MPAFGAAAHGHPNEHTMKMGRRPGRRTSYLLGAPLRRPRLVLVPLLLVPLAVVAIDRLSPARYRAHALVQADWDTSDDALLRQKGMDVEERRYQDLRRRVGDAASIERLLRHAEPDAPGRAPRRDEVEGWLRAVRVEPEGPSHFRVECVDADPARAARIANQVAAALVEGAGGDPARLADARRAIEEKRLALERARAGRGGPGGVKAARPAVQADAELELLQADYDRALHAYKELLEQWSAAEAASGAGRGLHSRFDIVRAASAPAQPEARGFVLLSLAGAALGLAIGLGAAVVAEHRDRSVKGPEDLAKILPVPLLALLPKARDRDRGD